MRRPPFLVLIVSPAAGYALDGSAQPLTVASYTYDTLPEAEQQVLSSPEAIVTALDLDNE